MVKLEITKKIKIQLFWVGVLFLGMLYIAASRHVSLGMKYQQVFFNDTHICDVNGDINVKQIARAVRKELALASEDKLAIDYRVVAEEAQKPFVPLVTEMELETILKHFSE